LNTTKQKGLQRFHLLLLRAVMPKEQDYCDYEGNTLHSVRSYSED
jgi:hypothetical protein